MLLQLNGIGNQKISYKDHTQIEFDSLHHYITLAKKAISKFSNKFYHGLSTKMLNDEDAISNIANAIMMADWRWDENYTNNKGTKKTKYSYRNQCALWAIQTYVTKNHKTYHKFKDVYSLDFIPNSQSEDDNYSLINDNSSRPPDDILIEQEQKNELHSLVNKLLSLECLSTRQKEYIRLYYFDDYTFEAIGKKYGITREAVRQGLNKAITLLRNSLV